MGDELQTAVLFTANLIESRNIMFLIPQKIILGECNDDTTYFFSYLDNKEYQNADNAVRENNYVCFYFVKTIKDLKEKFGLDNLDEICEKYFEDLFNKVYYYDLNNENSFEDYFLKSCSIEEFNNQFDLNFSYSVESQVEEQSEVELDPLTKNFKLIKSELDKNILFQNEAKNCLLNTLYDNAVTKADKKNIIISGPSGVGKSAMLQLLADVSTQPILYTKFSPNLIEDAKEYLDKLLLDSYYNGLSKKDELIYHTIIIDDFDKDFDYLKIAEVSDEITKFIQNGKRFVRYSKNSKNGLIFDSRQVTFVVCGNFSMVKREKQIPFEFFTNDNMRFNNIPLKLNNEELEAGYGFSKELLESFSTHIDFKPLTLDQAKKIIVCSNNSLFKVYCKKLNEQGIKINISDETIDLMCKKIYSKYNNIKNINEVISGVFKDIMINSFSLDENVEITINDETIKDHKKYILKNV